MLLKPENRIKHRIFHKIFSPRVCIRSPQAVTLERKLDTAS